MFLHFLNQNKMTKMLNLKNKKGDKLLSVYWFAILVIVAVGIVLMVNTFYGASYDVRKAESEILAQKVADCIYSGGAFNSQLFNLKGDFREDFKETFLDKCSLNFTIDENFQRPPYYIQVDFFQGADTEKKSFSITEGNQNWVSDCDLNITDRSKLATCTSQEFYAKRSFNSVYLVKILSIVGKVDQNTH